MKELRYKTFSWRTHKKNWRIKRSNVCQFELTFRCDLHCRHCYSDCYNKPAHTKKELTTRQVKFILDKVHQAGVIWLFLTGGDPLERDDFLEIYSYVKDKGFIVTIFTNGYSMTEEIADYFKERPPFVIEITLNAITEKGYEEISQIKGSFGKAMGGIRMITQSGLPLKIKTQVMKDNLEELPEIREFVENLGLKFSPSSDLHARLNGDLSPCNLRITPQEVLRLNKGLDLDSMNEENKSTINSHQSTVDRNCRPRSMDCGQDYLTPNPNLFRCAAGGGDGINLDPYGNMFLCNLIRQPSFNLLEVSIEDAFSRLLPLARGRKFTTDSKCKDCKIWEFCRSCPGKAYFETGDIEAPVEYYCELAHIIAEKAAVKLLNC